MTLTLRSPSQHGQERRFRPALESLESRETPSVSPMLAPVLGPALFAPADHGHGSIIGGLNHLKHDVSSLPPITITSIVQDPTNPNQLLATGKIGNTPFTAPVTMTVTQSTAATAANAADPSTPILNLHLGPIHLDLLGLKVDTSEICLNISAQTGPGNLLGNLLSGIANSLNGGLSLGSILSGLTADQTALLTGPQGLQGLLNGALGEVTSAATASPSATTILHLSLGPVNLNLLGLVVNLDNCAGGPITVDVSAQPGPGNLLGNLLSDVAHIADNLGLPTNLSQRLDQIAELIVADAALLGL